jgi:2-polyprenyl-3-methyl-5-hydroxy-6-metoxy-1,4-benzoquinol methylase
VETISSKAEVRDERGGRLSLWLQRRRFDVSRPYLSGRVLDFGSHHGALTQWCTPDAYLGVEHDPQFIEIARQLHPGYQFVTELPKGEKFDTVAAFAVIEHIKEPAAMLAQWVEALAPGGQIVLTTPHPRFEWIHTLGTKLGLFSNHAHDDHEDLIDRKLMAQLGAPAGVAIERYERFLFGANQLFVLRRRADD